MLRKYIYWPKNQDGLRRNENNFFKYIWPLLEGKQKKDRSIITFERSQYGRNIPVWQLR